MKHSHFQLPPREDTSGDITQNTEGAAFWAQVCLYGWFGFLQGLNGFNDKYFELQDK